MGSREVCEHNHLVDSDHHCPECEAEELSGDPN